MKSGRQDKIIELVNKYDIDTQQELARRLNEAGFKVTQATVSRDIRELKLSKVNLRGGKQKYVVTDTSERDNSEKLTRVMREGYVSSCTASKLVVIHTIPGMAMALAAALDAMALPGYGGCIAGDDTVFCAIREGGDEKALMDRIQQVLAKR